MESFWLAGRDVALLGFQFAVMLVRPMVLLLLIATGCGPVAAGDILAGRAAAGHPISITQVSAYVQREKATVAIDLFLEDLFLFHNLQPNAENRLEAATIEDGAKRHRRLLLERFQILDADTQPLKGVVVKVDAFDIPADGVPLGDLMSYSLTYTIEYPLDQPPRFLTFLQQLVDPSLGIPAEMTLRVKQAGVEGDRVWSLQTGKPEVVDFDWDAPPPSPEASDAEWEAWMEKKREATLGITSYSSVYSFIYIEDGEVRHEILVPLLTLEESVLIPRDDDLLLDLDEQQEAREQIGAFFAATNPVTIDGRVATAEVARIDFYGLNFVDFAKQAEAKPVGLANARVGIILRYPTGNPPTEVEVEWEFYNDFIFEVQAMIYTDDAVQQARFSQESEEQSRYRWKREQPWEAPRIVGADYFPPQHIVTVTEKFVGGGMLMSGILGFALLVLGIIRRRWSTVTLSVVVTLAGTGVFLCLALLLFDREPPPPSREEQLRVFRRLHGDLYQAFRHRQEEPLYDALAVSVDGPLLRKLYLQIRKSLVMVEQGGAVSRIQKVEIVDATSVGAAKEPESFRIRCRWSVEGTVEHWGHVHGRTNTYEGIFTVAPQERRWVFVDVELLQEEQTEIRTQLRGLPE